MQFHHQNEVSYLDEDGEEWLEGINETTSIYINSEDTTYKGIEISSTPQNYEENGEYYPIDSTIKETNEGYKNSTNVIETVFNNDINSKGILFTKDDIYVKYIPLLNSVGDPVVDTNQIIYPFENNTNIRYTINNGIIKEDIIYNTLNSQNEVSYLLEIIGGDVHLINNNLVIGSADDKLIINAPKAYDNAGSETNVTLLYEADKGILKYVIDEQWLQSLDRVYPITIDPQIALMAHQGLDTSAVMNDAYVTIGNPDLESNGWVLADQSDAYMYVGNNPIYGDSYSFYKVRDEDINNYLRGKYIKKAVLSLPIETSNSSNSVIACTINENYDIANATYSNLPTHLNECHESSYKHGDRELKIDITSYVKGVVEKGKLNNGISLSLKDDTKYITFNASEYYWVNQASHKFPGVKIEYYDSPDVLSDMKINDFTYQLRPMVKYKYNEGAAYFVGLGIDGKAPVDSNVQVLVKEKEIVNNDEAIEVVDNFYYYPNYPEIEDVPNKWTELESNYQLNRYLDNFSENKLYDVFVKVMKGSDEVTKHTWFRLYKVKNFDLINHIAAFYGVSTKTLIEDNNLGDELITEGNLLFIREPKLNKDIDYQNSELSITDKQVIDRALSGRGIQCEFGFEPINFNTGNFLLESEDFKLNIDNKEYYFNRLYNSTSSNVLGSNGYGFSNNGLSYIIETNEKVIVYLFDGKRYEYLLQVDNTYLSENGNDYTLLFNNDHFEMISLEEKLIYNKLGYIEKMIDKNNKETLFEYEDRLIKNIQFIYENSLLKEIVLNDNTKVQYQYDDKLNLIRFIDQTGKSVRYEYDENHRMIAWYNYENNLVVTNTYDEYGRVAHQRDGLNNEVSIQYDEFQTIAIDSLGNKTVYEIDALKQTKKVINENSEVKKTFKNGLLIEETLSNGVHYQYTYDVHRNLTSTTRMDGFKENYRYDENNNLIQYYNSANLVKSYSYDSNNNLISYTDSLGHTQYKEYENNLLVKEIDFNGNITKYEYYPNHSLKKVIYPDGSDYTYTYNESGFVTSVKDCNGDTTTHLLNERNELILLHYSDGSTKQFVYDNNGNLIKEKNERDYVSSKFYDLYGNVIKEIDNNGNIYLYEYDGNNNLIKKVNPYNEVSIYEYDESNRLIKKIENGLETKYIYNRYGIAEEINDKGQVKTYFYDNLGRIIRVNDFNHLECFYEYDILGNKIKEVDAYGNVIIYEYDKNNRLIKQKSSINEILFSYDYNGNLVFKSENGLEFFYEYDSRNNLVKETNPLGNFKTKSYYDGKLVQETDFQENRVIYSHNEKGLVIKETYENGLFKTYEYDKTSNLSQEVDTNGNSIKYVYDGNDNIIQRIDSYGNPTTYEYDKLNRIISITSPLGIKTGFVYDQNDNIITKTLSDRVIEEYTYDKYSNLIKQKINYLESVFEYDEYDRLIKKIDPYGLVSEYVYDKFNRIIEEKISDEVNKTYVYNNYNLVLEETDFLGNVRINTFDNNLNLINSSYKGITTTYEYDDNHQIIQETDSLGNVIKKVYNKNGFVIEETVDETSRIYKYDIFNNLIYVKNSLDYEVFYTYDGEGNLLQKINENGHIFDYEYDKNNVLIKEKVNSQTYKEYVYDQDQRLIKEIDGLGNYVINEYDKYNNLISHYDERGYLTKYVYDTRFNLIEETDVLGQKVINEYNSLNQLIKMTDKNNNTFKYEYDIFNNVIKEITPLQGTITKIYNTQNQLISETNQSGLKINYEYNDLGLLYKVSKNNTIVEINRYDTVGRLIERENSIGAIVYYEYDKKSNIIKEINPNGFSLTNEYDSENNLIKQINEVGLVSTYILDGLGNVIKEVVGDRYTSYTYDAFNNKTSSIDAYDNRTFYEYNFKNELSQVIDALGNRTLYEYNETGDLIKIVYPDLSEVNYVVDELGRVIQEKDALNHIISKTYDGNDNVLSAQNPKGYVMYYEYNALNTLIKEYSGASYEVNYIYDKANRLIKIKQANQKSELYEYDVFDNIVLETKKDGQKINYQYDSENRLIAKNDITYEYDLMNNLVKMSDSSGVSFYQYNSLNSLIQTNQLDIVTSYEYNIYNEKTRIIYPNKRSVDYTYDNNGNLLSASGLGQHVSYVYNELNQEIKRTINDEVIKETEYDVVGNIQKIKTTSKGVVVFEGIYEYDFNHSLIKENINQNGEIFVNKYTYNENDELIQSNKNGKIVDYIISIDGNKKEIHSDGRVIASEYNENNQITQYSDGNYNYSFKYDKNGNRISEIRNDNKVKNYTYNQYDELVSVKDFDETVYQYSYDGLGHRLSQEVNKEKTDYKTYDVEIIDSMALLIERLKRVSYTETGSLCLVSYYHKDEIDNLSKINRTKLRKNSVEDEMRYKKTIIKTDTIHQRQTTRILYVNDYTEEYEDVLAQIQDNSINQYLFGNTRISDNDEIYIEDVNGSVVLTLNQQLSIKEEYYYDDYGYREKKYNPFISNNEIGYNGEYHSRDGLIYLRARYYDSKSKVFINEDSYRGSIDDLISRNRYAYASNNPYKYEDPSGNKSAVRVKGGFINYYPPRPKPKKPVKIPIRPKVPINKQRAIIQPKRQSIKSIKRKYTQRKSSVKKALPIHRNMPHYTAESVYHKQNQMNYHQHTLTNRAVMPIRHSALKAKLVYNNLKNHIFKNEGAYKPVKGSLANKVKGICDKKNNFNERETFSKLLEWTGQKIDTTVKGAINLGKSALQFIDQNMDTIAQTGLAIGGAALTVMGVATSFGAVPVLALGATVVTGKIISAVAMKIAITSAAVAAGTGVAQVTTGKLKKSLIGNELDDVEAENRVISGISNTINAAILGSSAYILNKNQETIKSKYKHQKRPTFEGSEAYLYEMEDIHEDDRQVVYLKGVIVHNVSKQCNERFTNLPMNMNQTVYIDVRGQYYTDEMLEKIREKILEKVIDKSQVIIKFFK